MTRQAATTTATLLSEGKEIVGRKIIDSMVILVQCEEALALAGLHMVGKEAREAAVAPAASEVVGVMVVGHLLVRKPMLRCTL